MARFTFFGCIMAVIGLSSALTHRQASRRLHNEGITVYSRHSCSDKSKTYCVSLEGIRDDTVDTLIALRKVSDCLIVVIGGTEVGHDHFANDTYTHENGYRISILYNDCTYNIISSRFILVSPTVFRDAPGNEYSYEVQLPSHWDILVIGSDEADSSNESYERMKEMGNDY